MGRINYPINDMENNPAMFQTTNQNWLVMMRKSLTMEHHTVFPSYKLVSQPINYSYFYHKS